MRNRVSWLWLTVLTRHLAHTKGHEQKPWPVPAAVKGRAHWGWRPGARQGQGGGSFKKARGAVAPEPAGAFTVTRTEHSPQKGHRA